jgi:acetate kinase
LRTQAQYLSCNILVLNCGSSSIKYQVIDPISKDILLKGSTDRLNETIYQQSIEKIFHLVDNSGISLSAIGHRWVNGGKYFSKPILVTDQMISQLQEIIPLAPYAYLLRPAPPYLLLILSLGFITLTISVEY